MLYLLDASVLITAHDNFYEPDRVPEFWEWLIHICNGGHAKMPKEIFDEIAVSTGGIGKWIRQEHVKTALLLDEEVDPGLVAMVISEGYALDLTDDEVELIANDPFLVASALQGKERIVVTCETSKPSRKRGNRKLPDVCNDMSVTVVSDFEFYRNLDFRTSWKAAQSR